MRVRFYNHLLFHLHIFYTNETLQSGKGRNLRQQRKVAIERKREEDNHKRAINEI